MHSFIVTHSANVVTAPEIAGTRLGAGVPVDGGAAAAKGALGGHAGTAGIGGRRRRHFGYQHEGPGSREVRRVQPSYEGRAAPQGCNGFLGPIDLGGEVALLLGEEEAAGAEKGQGELREHGHSAEGAGEDGVEGLAQCGVAGQILGAAVVDGHGVESQDVDQLPQKRGLLPVGLQEPHSDAWEGDLEWQAGKAPAAAHVQDAAAPEDGGRQREGDGQGVQEVGGADLLPTGYGGEVGAVVPLGEGVVVPGELPKLCFVEVDAQGSRAQRQGVRG